MRGEGSLVFLGVNSLVSEKTLRGTQSPTWERRGMPEVMAPVGSITHGLTIVAPVDDRAEHLVLAKAEVAQEVVGEKFQTVAILGTLLEGLLQRGPMVDRPVGHVVATGLLLDPARKIPRKRALVLGAKARVLPSQARLRPRRLAGGLPSTGHRGGRLGG
jgi:hypothetical protein